MASASKAIVVLAFTAAGASADVGAQQLPPQGCNACVTAAHAPTSSGAALFRVAGFPPYGPGKVAPEVHLSIPPPPQLRDTGAVEASARIVLGRNRKLRESLAVAEAASRPPKPVVPQVDGEVVIRIASIHPPPPAGDIRRDIPRDAFEAIPLRRVPYPQWSPAPR